MFHLTGATTCSPHPPSWLVGFAVVGGPWVVLVEVTTQDWVYTWIFLGLTPSCGEFSSPRPQNCCSGCTSSLACSLRAFPMLPMAGTDSKRYEGERNRGNRCNKKDLLPAEILCCTFRHRSAVSLRLRRSSSRLAFTAQYLTSGCRMLNGVSTVIAGQTHNCFCLPGQFLPGVVTALEVPAIVTRQPATASTHSALRE